MNADNHRETPLTREELERLAADPIAAAEWEEHQRMEDALRPLPAPANLHARIMSRVQAEPMPAARIVTMPWRAPLLRVALVAAALSFVVVGALRPDRETVVATVPEHRTPNPFASFRKPSLELPSEVLRAAAPARLEEEGRELGRLAGSIVAQAASPLRGAASLAQGGESSTTAREPSS